MKRLLIIFLLALLTINLSGCVWICPKPEIVIIEKKIPVPVKCDAPAINTPTEYPFDRAKKEMTTFEKLRLAISELEIYRGYTKELEAVKNKCTADPATTKIQ